MTMTSNRIAVWVVTGIVLIGWSTSPVAGQIGPDVYVAELYDLESWGSSGGIEAYSIGTIACNQGDEPLQWHSWDRFRPVIGQNLFRLKDGKIEQVGQSWLKWGFASLNQDYCGSCEHPGTGSALGVGCSDPYSAWLNGLQSGLGAKSVVNPFTGEFPADPANPTGPGTIAGRVQVHVDDIDPAANPGALYFAEGHYVHPDDASYGNDHNNASYRQVWVTAGRDLTFNDPAGGTSDTEIFSPGIQAWADHDPEVQLVMVDIPNEGRLYVAWRASDLGGGSWSYEFAIYNLNSDRAVGGVAISIGDGATLSNIGFHDVDYHSGEPYAGDDWSATQAGNTVSWATEDYATNQNANALRWGTLYNFRFDADVPPSSVTQLVLSLFKPGTPDSVTVPLGAPLPNDDCANAQPISDVAIAFDTTGATTDGPDEPDLCDLAGYTHIESDIWYSYTATCTGDATVSLCGSDFDTKLAVYAGACPTGPGEAIACDDDACGSQSETTFEASEGQTYLIRVGGRFGAQGTGAIAISIEIGYGRGDINGDGAVDLGDLAILLANYEQPAPTDGDLDGDGDVDLGDLAIILAHYGTACD